MHIDKLQLENNFTNSKLDVQGYNNATLMLIE